MLDQPYKMLEDIFRYRFFHPLLLINYTGFHIIGFPFLEPAAGDYPRVVLPTNLVTIERR